MKNKVPLLELTVRYSQKPQQFLPIDHPLIAQVLNKQVFSCIPIKKNEWSRVMSGDFGSHAKGPFRPIHLLPFLCLLSAVSL